MFLAVVTLTNVHLVMNERHILAKARPNRENLTLNYA